jgi:endonuclease III
MGRDPDFFENVREITERLDEMHERSDLGNKDDPFDELVYIVLSTRTEESLYKRTFERVKKLVGDWNHLPEISLQKLESAIEEAGLTSKKARTLKRIASRLQKKRGEVSLDHLKEMRTKKAEEFLLDLHGVGPKTAKCVLMYSLDRPVFPVDTHCVRVANRLGWLNTTARRYTKSQMDRIQERVPSELRKMLHVRLVQHGRSICTDRDPTCEDCSLSEFCDHFQKVSK